MITLRWGDYRGGGRSRRGNNVNLQNRRANVSDAERQATNCVKETFGATVAGGVVGPVTAAGADAGYAITGQNSCSIVRNTLFN